MEPERAIENLIYRYAELLDGGDLPAVAALFRNAVIVAPDGREQRGYDAVLAMYRASARIHGDGTPRTQHVTTNVQVELSEDGREAEARSVFTVFQALEDFPLQAIIAGRYRDEFALAEGGWEFRRREIYPTLFGDLSRHLLFDADALR